MAMWVSLDLVIYCDIEDDSISRMPINFEKRLR